MAVAAAPGAVSAAHCRGNNVPWGLVTHYGVLSVVQFAPFERRREDALETGAEF